MEIMIGEGISIQKEKLVPLEKQSKKEQKKFHDRQRGSWNGVNPVTRIVPNGKAYDRNKVKRETNQDDI